MWNILISEVTIGGVSSKKGVLKSFAKFLGKHKIRSHYFSRLASLKPTTALNFAKFLRAPFLQNTSRWLLPLYVHCVYVGSRNNFTCSFINFIRVYILYQTPGNFLFGWFKATICILGPYINNTIDKYVSTRLLVLSLLFLFTHKIMDL